MLKTRVNGKQKILISSSTGLRRKKMFNKIKDAYIAVKATLRAIIKDGKIIFIYRCAVVAAIIILYVK